MNFVFYLRISRSESRHMFRFPCKF